MDLRVGRILKAARWAGLAAALALCLPIATHAANLGRWGDEVGVETADDLIGRCLAGTRQPSSCTDSAWLACASERNTSSQLDLNDCAGFSRKAWERRYAAQVVRAKGVLGRWSREPDSGERTTVATFEENEHVWRAWIDADCRTRTLSGGSIYGMRIAICVARHLAVRTLDLTTMADEWERG